MHSDMNEKRHTPAKELRLHSLGEIRNDMSEPPPAIIDDGILLARTLSLVYGKPKSKKSFLVLNLAIAIATGTSFAGFRVVKSRRVLVLSAEGGYFSMRKRIQCMLKTFGVENDENLNIATDARINLLDESIENLRKAIKEFRPEVVVLDPLIRFHSADENSSKEMGRVMGVVRGLIEDYGISVILVHHTGKNADNGARGSSAITGEYDSAIAITKSGDNGTKYKLEFDMRHVETPPDRNLAFNIETNWFECIDENPVERSLRECKEPALQSSVVKSLVEKGMPRSTAYANVKKSIKSGAIEKLENGRLVCRN